MFQRPLKKTTVGSLIATRSCVASDMGLMIGPVADHSKVVGTPQPFAEASVADASAFEGAPESAPVPDSELALASRDERPASAPESRPASGPRSELPPSSLRVEIEEQPWIASATSVPTVACRSACRKPNLPNRYSVLLTTLVSNVPPPQAPGHCRRPLLNTARPARAGPGRRR